VAPCSTDAKPSKTQSNDSSDINIPFLSLERAGYVFTQEIARVNHGAIKLANHTTSASLRCVKCYDKVQLRQETFEFLKLEAELMFDLGKHPNIGGVIEFFQDCSSYYLVQPYYRGGDLVGLKKKAVAACVVPTEQWWNGIVRQCLEGLAHMHAQGVMHCDIKEPNIMLREEDLCEPEVVIIDLGVAQRASTNRSIVYGTPGYIPPEVWEVKNWLPESDMFSLGVVMVQMMIGKVGIFTEGTRTYRDIKEATQVRLPPFELMPLECPNLRVLAERLLAKDHQVRPTAASVLSEPWKDIDTSEEQLSMRKKARRQTCHHDEENLKAWCNGVAVAPMTTQDAQNQEIGVTGRKPRKRHTFHAKLEDFYQDESQESQQHALVAIPPTVQDTSCVQPVRRANLMLNPVESKMNSRQEHQQQCLVVRPVMARLVAKGLPGPAQSPLSVLRSPQTPKTPVIRASRLSFAC
jgi:serine/threonine protein kinase